MPESPSHVPVLIDEIVQWLAPKPGQFLVDGTLGGGGHTRRLAECVGPDGCVLALDRDEGAITAAETNLKGLPVKVAHANYADLPEVLEEIGSPAVDGIVLDLGLSSDQLADRSRGFSFESDGPLDLRFDVTTGEPAAHLINRLKKETLADLIFEFGEERYSRRIAEAILRQRDERPIATAADLAALVRRTVPRNRHDRIDPATRTFQALRIAVNEELRWLEVALRRLPDTLRLGGRLAIISFHSLEDRRVKQGFRDDPRMEALTRKPIEAGEAELAANNRSRSARLRVAERVA